MNEMTREILFRGKAESGKWIVCSYHMSDGFDENDFCSHGVRKPQKEGDVE